jgi:hypothetical protein
MNYRVLFDHILVDEMKWEYNTFSHALVPIRMYSDKRQYIPFSYSV